MRGSLPIFALVIAACDPTWVLDVEVTLDPAAREAAGAPPQAVFLAFDGYSNSPSSVAAIICEGGDQPVVIATKKIAIGCGDPGTIHAWVDPKPPDLDLPCGALEYDEYVGVRSASAGAWRASAPVFADGGRCSHHDRVALTLAPP